MHFETVHLVRSVVLAAVCIAVMSAGAVLGQEGPVETISPAMQLSAPAEPQSGRVQGGYGILYFPTKALYAPYAADPRQVGFGLQVQSYTRSRIPESSGVRFDLKTGGQFHFMRIHPKGREDLGLQVSLEGGFHSQFDIIRHLDNLGWDGRYGLLLSTAVTRNLAFRIAYLHDSSHVGDEYAERTGRLRIGYTREEIAGGVSWLSDNGWRVYGEYAHARPMGNEELERPGRAQFGLEWYPAKFVQGRYRGWYAAADVSGMQERDWKRDIALQTGYRIDTVDKTWRFGIDWYTGRPPIGEFFQHSETYFGFGLRVDI